MKSYKSSFTLRFNVSVMSNSVSIEPFRKLRDFFPPFVNLLIQVKSINLTHFKCKNPLRCLHAEAKSTKKSEVGIRKEQYQNWPVGGRNTPKQG